eukprot:scaffold4597_cov162-Amphora_coffeaeformis.AAC.2
MDSLLFLQTMDSSEDSPQAQQQPLATTAGTGFALARHIRRMKRKHFLEAVGKEYIAMHYSQEQQQDEDVQDSIGSAKTHDSSSDNDDDDETSL